MIRRIWRLSMLLSVAVILFAGGYFIGSGYRYDTEQQQDSIFPEEPSYDADIWLPADEASDLYVDLLQNTEVIVIRSWVKDPHPNTYTIISSPEEIDRIVQATTIQYRRDPQPLLPSYQIFLLSLEEAYVINYRRIPNGRSVFDLQPVTVSYDAYGRIIKFSRKQADNFRYVQAYPSPLFQQLVEKYIKEDPAHEEIP